MTKINREIRLGPQNDLSVDKVISKVEDFGNNV